MSKRTRSRLQDLTRAIIESLDGKIPPDVGFALILLDNSGVTTFTANRPRQAILKAVQSTADNLSRGTDAPFGALDKPN